MKPPASSRKTVAAKDVRRELLPEQSPELLKTLHLLTRDGVLNADARRKLKQVNHFVGLLQPAIEDALAGPSPSLLDLGSGNAYLGFVIYELFLKSRESGELVSVDARAELSERARTRAEALGYARMRFATSEIATLPIASPVGLVTALHACDTATDDAIAFGIANEVPHIAVVPCCQAEVAQLLKAARPTLAPAMTALFSHAWHRREFGSHLTNVIRALVLESRGYQVTVTELTGWEHSLKNELILARKVQPSNGDARARLEALLAATGIRPKLIRLLS